MISESLVHLGEKKSGIRELFEYGLRQAAVVGKENVYDYSLGNPSVPAPEEVASIIRELLEGDSLALHGYTPAGGAKEAQQAVANDLTQRSGDTIRPENIFFTCGAAPALVAVLRALAVADAEFVAIARNICVLCATTAENSSRSRPIRRISRSISPLWSARSRRTRRPFWSILRTIPPV